MKAKTDKITLLSNPEALKILREYVEREREKQELFHLLHREYSTIFKNSQKSPWKSK